MMIKELFVKILKWKGNFYTVFKYKFIFSSSWQESGRGQTRGQMLQDVKTKCVPVKYKPQSLYILDDDNIPTIIMLNDLVASKCGCR